MKGYATLCNYIYLLKGMKFNMKKEIGSRIREIRKSLNMNKEQFAKLIGISGQFLGMVESGDNGLSLERAIILCEKTNTSADYLLFGKKNITDENLKHVFDNIDKTQIIPAFESLQNIALFIKSKN